MDQNVTAGTIASGSILRAPLVSPDKNVTGVTIAAGAIPYAPGIGQLIAGTIAAGAATFPPTVIDSLPFLAVTNSVRASISSTLRLLRRQLRLVKMDLPPAFSDLEPGRFVYYAESSQSLLSPTALEFDGRLERLVPLMVLSITDHVEPARVGVTFLDLRETFCSWWSPLITEIGMTGDLDGIAIFDRAGGWQTERLQLAYGERPGGDNAYIEVGENAPMIERYGLRAQGGLDTNLLLNSAFREGTGDTFTSWTPTTTGAAIVVQWQLYTLIASPGWQRAVQIATYGSGQAAYISQAVSAVGGKKLFVRVFYKDGGAVDRMAYRVQRSDDSSYWRDSDQTWQGTAIDNPITPATGVLASLMHVSKLLDMTGLTTNVTVSVGHFAALYGSAQISQIQGVELIEQDLDEGPYCRWRTPLPTRAATVQRLGDLVSLTNDDQVRVVFPARGAAKFTVRPHWDHVDLLDLQQRYIWSSDFDGATGANYLRCYYERVDSSNGQWCLESSEGSRAILAVSGGGLAVRDTEYVVAARWTSESHDEHGLTGQALDIWVDGVRGTTVQGLGTPTADASCPVYLGSSPNSGPPKTSRLLVVGGPYWSRDQDVSFPGYDGVPGTPPQTQYRADSDKFMDDALHWLAQKSGPLNVLVVNSSPPSGSFGQQMIDGLTRLGHSYALTTEATGFGAFEPLDFDVVICPSVLNATSYHGFTSSKDKFDYILSNNGAVLTENTGSIIEWNRYGIGASGFHSSHTYQRPFYCTAIGNGSTLYKLAQYTTVVLVSDTNTKGGTRTIYYCDTHGTEGVVALWSNDTTAWSNSGCDVSLTHGVFCAHCPTEAELLRM